MKNTTRKISRRHFIQGLGVLSAGITLMPQTVFGESRQPIKHAIPSSGERIPVIGMGTSRTFDVGENSAILTQLGQVLQVFFDNGGAVIDSSPMYGNSETIVGDLLKSIPNKDPLFAATKVWTYGKQSGIDQMQESMQRTGHPINDQGWYPRFFQQPVRDAGLSGVFQVWGKRRSCQI